LNQLIPLSLREKIFITPTRASKRGIVRVTEMEKVIVMIMTAMILPNITCHYYFESKVQAIYLVPFGIVKKKICITPTRVIKRSLEGL